MSMGSMSIITMMKRAAAMIMKAMSTMTMRSMSIIMTTAKTAPAAATIMSITTIIMQMKYLPAGAWKLLFLLPGISWRTS